MRILVVDDAALDAEALAAWLGERGHEAEWTVNADGAFARLALHPFDALIVDHYLPDVDGLGVVRRVRQEPIWRAMPVVIRTAAAAGPFEEIEWELADLQPAMALRKPCEAGVVLAAIEALRTPERE